MLGSYHNALRDDNQFHIVCPIFGAETPIRSCFELREMVWKGDKPNVRKGCQVCLHSGKCPINNILLSLNKEDEPSLYYSQTKVVGRLKQKHLDKIEHISTPNYFMRGYDLSEKETKLIEQANENAKVFKASERKKVTRTEAMETVAAPKQKEKASIDAGDISSAINEAIKEGQ